MTPLYSVFFLILLFLNKTAPMDFSKQHKTLYQNKGSVVANVGDTLTFVCSYNISSLVSYFLYKQTLDQSLTLISTFDTNSKTGHFYGDFRNNSRFKLENVDNENKLQISNVQFSDSATYFCAQKFVRDITFNIGTTVRVKGSALNVSVLSEGSASQTLNCTVFTGGCWQEHIDDAKTQDCLRFARSYHHTCLYTPRKKSKDQTQAEFNLCSLASCGHELFRTAIESNVEGEDKSFLCFLSGGLACTIILSLILAFILYKLKNSRNQEIQPLSSSSSPTSAEEEVLHYAAVNFHQRSSTGRNRPLTNTEAVYSRVRTR